MLQSSWLDHITIFCENCLWACRSVLVVVLEWLRTLCRESRALARCDPRQICNESPLSILHLPVMLVHRGTIQALSKRAAKPQTPHHCANCGHTCIMNPVVSKARFLILSSFTPCLASFCGPALAVPKGSPLHTLPLPHATDQRHCSDHPTS